MNNIKLTIVVCSRSSLDEKKDFIDMLNKTCGVEYKLIFVHNTNNVPLSNVYNQMFTNINTEFAAFIHDDIKFIKKGWGSELIRLFEDNQEYGIIGVVGSAQFDINASWWLYDRRFGQVIHDTDEMLWLSEYSPLLEKDLEEVCVIDGLFIGINKSKVYHNFDANLPGFHMYDIDFSLKNYLFGDYKIGVTTNIRLSHKSVGMITDEWYKSREIINNKYKNYYPINVKNEE